MAYGKLPGDWEQYRDESKMLAAIEPVTEGIMQLFCQTIILYIVNGPGEDAKHHRPIDFSHLVYDDDWSKILYMCLLATSLTSVGTSLAKVSNLFFQLRSYAILIAIVASGFWRTLSCKENSFLPVFEGLYYDYYKVLNPELFDEHYCEVGHQSCKKNVNFHTHNLDVFCTISSTSFNFHQSFLKFQNWTI